MRYKNWTTTICALIGLLLITLSPMITTPALAQDTTVNLAAAEDTYLSAAATTTNYGGSETLEVNRTSGTSRRTALLKWDLSSIPTNATVTSASITLNVTETTAYEYRLFNMRRTWEESTATWTTTDGSTTWATAGAASTSTDRHSTNLWGAGTSTFSSTGGTTVSLNADGIDVVQDWIGGATNYGLIIQYYTGSTSDPLIFSSSESANPPVLNVTYSAPTDPYITTSGTLNAFSGIPGTPSAEQSYAVAGGNLTEAIIITPPTDFELSLTSGSGFSSDPISLSPDVNNEVASTPIYVRFNSSTVGTSIGNITHSSGAIEVDLTVGGTALPLTTWAAYNDSAWNSGEPDTNITQISIYDTTSGTLVKRSDGSSTGVTAAFTLSDPSEEGEDFQVTNSGAEAAAGTDAYNIFNGNVSTDGVVNGMGSYADWWIDLTLSGLNPAKTYTFAGTSVRNSSSYTDRNSTFILSGDDTAANASSSGVTVVDDHTIAFNTGYNSQGYVVRWAGINPGSDGMIVIRTRASTTTEIAGSDDNAYGLSVFMLAEEMGDDPTIITEGTLTPFSTQPGTPSAAQTYTVSGSNLTDGIEIAAPAGFELSTDGSTYSGSLTLNHTGGSVPVTTVYVRLTGAEEGAFSGDIVHTSGTITQNVAVSGEVAIAPTIATFQQGIDGYAGTVDTYLESEDADADNSTATLVVDLDPEQHILLRFESIFGNDPGQIPPEAIIQSASLEINVTNASDEGALLHRMLQSWNDTDTWNTWGDGIDADGIEAETTADSSSSGSSTGTATLDVTTDVQVWSNNPSSNFGWTWLPPSGDDSWQFRSAEGTPPPKLTVTYFPPSTEPPAAPTALSATATSSTQIDLSWTDNADNESGFEIERSTDGSGGPFSLLDTVPANTTAYPDTGLDAESEYCYRVRATNSVGDSAYTDVACATTPAEPTIVTFQQGVDSYNGTVDTFIRGTDEGDTNFSGETGLEWDDNTDTTTDEITLIRFTDIFSSEGGPIPDGATIVSATLTYTTTSSSSAGGDEADVYESLVDWPESTVTWNNFGGDAGVDADEYENLIDSASADSNSTAYSIDVTASLQRWSADPSANLGWIFLPTGSDGVTIYSAEGDTPPKLTVTYFPPSTEPPAAPMDLSATAVSSTQIDLSWTDNADNESGFEVWSADSVGTPGALLETVGANTTSYSDTGLEPETEYCYVVRATNSAGESAYTDVACATTQAAPTTVTIQVRVNQESDDAEERNDTGAVDLDGDTSTHSLQMYRKYGGSSTSTLNWWGLRFQNVNVPQGATIISATVTFRANADSDTTASGMTLWGQLAANPGTFTDDDDNITDRTKTTATAAWSVPEWASGSDYATPSLAAIVQEIVDQSDWAADNALVIIGQTTETQNRSAISYDGTDGATLAPLLEICYTQEPSGPTINTSGTLNAFSTTPGIPSDAQTYTVFGSNLEANINIDAPDGFELSTDGSTYAANLTLPESGGTVGSTTIYVRLTGAEGTSSGNIEHTSTNATTKNVAVSGTAGWCVTVSFQQGTEGYTGAHDTYIRQADPTYNYGETMALTIDSDEPYSTDGYDASALLYWDISSIPTGSTIESASITVYVEDETDSATPGYNMYEMTQAWTEGTGDGSVTGDGATWNTYDGTNAWPGGAGGASDLDSAILANFAATETGSYQVDLDDDGKAVLENWVNTPANNRGFMIHAGEEDNGLDFTSKEGSTVANRPKLTITYCLAPTTPYIAVSGTLSPFASTIGVPSDEQSYTVLGLNLTGAITITAPADFEISTTSESDFGSSVSLTPDGDGTVAATPIYVRFFRASSGTSSGSITHASPDATTRNVAVSGTAVSNPPAASLVQPADDATGLSTSPTLQVTVTDPDADTMSVSFYGRPVGGSGGEDFTIFVYPDTQSHVDSAPEAVIFNAMSDYVVAKQAEFNVAFATYVGDIVMNAGTEEEWKRADAAMDILDPAGIPYSVGPGNHDQNTTLYNQYFGSARFEGNGHYQGPYATGQNENNYSFFSASGMDFIVINLQYNSTSAHWDWADDLLKDYPTRRGIVAQHNILNVDNSWQSTASQNLYNALKDNPNLFLMLCGHMHSGSDGSAYRLETRTGMDPVHILLTDYQDYNSSGNTGYMRILTFKPADDDIDAQIYSPYVDAYLTSASNYEQFTMDYDMDGSAAFELIGTVNGIANGGNASIIWSGLAENSEYEWYAVVSDGSLSTTGPTWSFTTGTTTNNPPVIMEGMSTSVTMSEDGSPTTFSLTLNATDADVGDTLTWIIASPASHGTATALGTGTSQVIGYTPISNYYGSDSFVVQVSDGNGGTDTITVNVTIDAVNDAPVITEGDSVPVTMSEDGFPTGFSLTLHATEVDTGDTLTWSIASGASHGTATASGTGTYTPNANYYGPDSFVVQVSDGKGGTDSITVNVTIEAVNDAPVVSDIPDQSIAEGGAFATINLDDYVSDVDNTDAQMTWTYSGNTELSVSITDRVATITAPASWNGPETITFKATDPAPDALSDEDAATFTVTAIQKYTITAMAGVNGSIEPSGDVTVTAGDDQSFTITPAVGYIIADVLVDGDSVGTMATYTFENVQADHTIHASFEQLPLSGSVTSSAVPSNATPNFDDQITVDINIDVSGVAAPNEKLGNFTGTLAWDTAVLEYQSDSGVAAGFIGAVNVSSGQIAFDGAREDGVTGDIPVLSVTFKVIGAAGSSSSLNLEYTAMAAAYTGNDLLPVLTVNDSMVQVSSQVADLMGTVVLQGRPATPDSIWIVSLTVKLYNADTHTLAYEFTPTTDNTGVFTISGITPGAYEIAVKNSHTLQVVDTVTLIAGSNSHDFGILLEGDANDSNVITFHDFSILSFVFGTCQGNPNFDDQADFNESGCVTVADFSLFSINYGQRGEEIPK